VISVKSLGSSGLLVANQKYGNSTLVISLHETATVGSGFNRAGYLADATQYAAMTVIDWSGNILVPRFTISYSLSGSDGMYVLSNGAVAWPAVTSTGYLMLSRVPAPSRTFSSSQFFFHFFPFL